MEIKLLIVGPLLTNCYLLISERELLIIDPGGGIKKILNEISQIKIKPKYIINTHFHWDHTFGNKIIKKITGAKILIHEGEKDFIKPTSYPPPQDLGWGGVEFEVDKFLKEGDKIKIGDSVLKVLHTPGHTKGGICLLGKNFIFTGDTLFKDGYGRTDLPGGSEKNLQASLEKLKKILKPGVTVYPGHGEIFTIEGMLNNR